MGTREGGRDRELLSENGVAKSSTPTATPATPSSHGHELGWEKVYDRMCHTFSTGDYVLSSFNLFGRCNCTFQLMLKRLGLNIRSKEIKTSDFNNDTGLGLATSNTFIFLIGIFMSSWLGASVLTLGEWFIKKMPLVSYIYSASKQISVAISPVVLQKGVGEDELCCVYVPTNHLYLGDLFLISSKDILRSNLSIREGIEIVISGGMSVPKIFTTIDPLGNPTTRIVNFEASV
ncbi:hypothetical protein CXB51_000883 [Gossypium anomalum]|uniref:Uncharacterized protein n=1 Tax=Gossypium anomalum TaxID=47600 RepID=A0A8J6D986_9ROSI|nr:hypothetical protein CXB51_000883 [Gossypium anomalum]